MGTRNAPFTSEQVESINAFQKCDSVHPFTCGHGHTLVASKEHLTCPECPDYKQYWVWSIMAEWNEETCNG